MKSYSMQLLKFTFSHLLKGFSPSSVGKEHALQRTQETWVRSLGLEKEMATHSSILAWKIPMDRGA